MSELVVEIGNVYKRRDGLEVYVYAFNPINTEYNCILKNTGIMYSVYEDGTYLQSSPSQNDLVELVK